MGEVATAVSIPGTPLLIPQLTGAHTPAGCDELRTAVADAVRQLADSTDPLWLIGPAAAMAGPPADGPTVTESPATDSPATSAPAAGRPAGSQPATDQLTISPAAAVVSGGQSAAAEADAQRQAAVSKLDGVLAHRPGDVTGLAGFGHHVAESRADALLPTASNTNAAHDALTAATPIELQVAQLVLRRAGVDRPVRLLSLTSDCPAETHQGMAEELADQDVVFVADGSACLGPKPPRGLNDAAQGSHDELVAALAAGDPAGLVKLTADEAADQWVAGYQPWQLMAAWAERSVTVHQGRQQPPHLAAQVTFDQAPYGVGYVVAVWQKTAVVGG